MTEIVIAPFSNNALRDWPAGHYRETIGLMLDSLAPDARISVVGTRGQRVGAAEIVRPYPADRVRNDCGIAWDAVLDKLRRAVCVIGNNSGITHASRHFGVPTVCVFGGSHQRTEWGPLGPNVVILSRVIGCSPCQFNHAWECPYNAACLREIVPAEVADAALTAVTRTSSIRQEPREALAEHHERKVATC